MNIFSKYIRLYFSKRMLPHWCVLLMDLTIVFLTGVFVFWILSKSIVDIDERSDIINALLCYMALSVVGFRMFHTYSGIIRYSSFIDLQRVCMANLITLVLASTAHQFSNQVPVFEVYTFKTVLMEFIISSTLMSAVRVVVKRMYEIMYVNSRAVNVLIYGVHDGGIGLAKAIRTQKDTKFRLKGFISHDATKKKYRLLGEPVYVNQEDLIDCLKRKEIVSVLVSPLQIDRFREDQELQDILLSHDIEILIEQKPEEWNGEKPNNPFHLKEVIVEDLLPRDKIEIDMDQVGELLTNKKILITGAAGSIGSEMVRQIAIYHPAELILIDQAETPLHDVRLFMAKNYAFVTTYTIVTNICNESRMEKIFSEHRPDYVFHAAAYKHVPMMEDNPSESVQNNVYGTRVIADLAVKYGTKKFVMVSTDKAVNPTNVMGCSKRICEIYVQSLNKAIQEGKIEGVTRFVTTRFGNVLGSNGSVIPLFRKQLQAGGPLTVTHPDIIRYFMLIPEACKLVLQAGTMGQGGEIYIFDMGKPVKIADLAKRMIRLSGLQNIEIKYTGLRDGEKLFEELLNDKETTKESSHPKIKIAKVREYEYEVAKANEDRLYQASFAYDDMQTVRIMKEIVPEFKSQHSKYEVLDK